MAICKRRDRVVVFRVTDDEHTQLQRACETSGCPNLSEFVRVELLNRVQSRMAARLSVAGLEKRLSDLEATYVQTVKCLQTVTGQTEKDTDERG